MFCRNLTRPVFLLVASARQQYLANALVMHANYEICLNDRFTVGCVCQIHRHWAEKVPTS